MLNPGSVPLDRLPQILLQTQEPVHVLLLHVVDVPLAVRVDDLETVATGVRQAFDADLDKCLQNLAQILKMN